MRGGVSDGLSFGAFALALAAFFFAAVCFLGLVSPESLAAGGGVFRLPRWVGYGRAMEMALTAEPILAEEAREIGLVTRLTEPGQALPAALELAQRIARNAPLGLAASKRLIREAQGMPEADFWVRQDALRASVFGSDDAREGARAFLERRDPQWSGR